MHIPACLSRGICGVGVQKRIQALQEVARRLSARSGRISSHALTLMRALAFLGASGLLGFFAYGVSKDEALRGWLLQNPPSVATWKHALSASGFRETRDLLFRQRAARSLPATMDADGTVWLAEDMMWIAISGAAGGDFVLLLTRCRTDAEAKKIRLDQAKWENVGTGWEAFDRVLGRAAKNPLAAAQKTPAQKGRFHDPREIRY